MTPEQLIGNLLSRFDGTIAVDAWGKLRSSTIPAGCCRGVYFATVKQKDGENDRASKLDRDGVFRFNVGTAKPLFLERFGPPPFRPDKGRTIDGPWNFTALDTITPHPIYGWMSWVSVLNPSDATLTDMDEIIEAAFRKAKMSFEKKVTTTSS